MVLVSEFFLFGILWSLSASQRVVDPCQFWDEAVYFQGKCYKLFTDQWLDWPHAQFTCLHQSSNGRLAEPDSVQVLTFLGRMAGGAGSSVLKGWVGARYNETGNKYLWDSKEGVKVEGSIPSLEDGCLTLSLTSSTLQAELCSSFQQYICEQEVPNPCDVILPGSQFFKGSCYSSVTKTLSQPEAQTNCNSKGAFLAEPKSAEVVYFLSTVANGLHWIGGKYLSSAMPTFWESSGEKVGSDVTNIVLTAGKCLAFTGTISDEDCSQPRQYLCQRDIGDPCELSYPGSVYASGFCFDYVQTPQTYQSAEETCAAKNGFIAELHTERLFDFVLDYMIYRMKVDHTSCAGKGSAPIWIGATYLNLDFSTRWRSNGQLAEDRQQGMRWHDRFGPGDACAVMTGYGFWEQRACGAMHAFICQTKISETTRQQYVIPLAVWSTDSVASANLYMTATTSLISHKVYLEIQRHTKAQPKPTVSKTHIDKDTTHFMSLHEFVLDETIIEVLTSHPVTLTLSRGGSTVLTSTLIFPTMHDNWLYESSYFVLASPVFPSVATKIKLALVAVQSGDTTVTISIPEILSADETVTLHTRVVHTKDLTASSDSIDGGYIEADKEIVVFFMQIKDSGQPGEAFKSLKQLPPYSLLGSEVIALPSNGTGTFSQVSMKVASTEAMSYVLLPYTMTETYTTLDPAISGDVYARYISNPESALDVALLMFDADNDVSSSYPAANAFVVQTGNASFYSAQSFALHDNPDSFCTMSLIPQSLWKHRYVAILFPGSPQVLDLSQADVFLYLVLETDLQENVLVNGVVRLFECKPVQDGFGLSGCVGQLEMGELGYDKILNIEMTKPFGVYAFIVLNSRVLSCHPLGIDLPPQNFYMGPFDMTPDTVTLLPETTTAQTTTPLVTTETAVTTEPPTTVATTEDPCINMYTNPTNAPGPTGPTVQTTPPNQPTIPTYTCTIPGNIKTNLSIKETEELVQSIQKALFVSPGNTTMAKRKKVSAEDKRSSSAYIGVLGIVLFSLEVALIMLPDVINIYRFFYP